MLKLQSANASYGDRADPSQWSEVEGPVKVHHASSSGWCLNELLGVRWRICFIRALVLMRVGVTFVFPLL